MCKQEVLGTLYNEITREASIGSHALCFLDASSLKVEPPEIPSVGFCFQALAAISIKLCVVLFASQ